MLLTTSVPDAASTAADCSYAWRPSLPAWRQPLPAVPRNSALGSQRKPVRWCLLWAATCLLLATSGCGPNGSTNTNSAPPLSVGAAQPDALQLLQQMVRQYRSATRYADRGQLQLRYRQPEGWVESQAPLAVRLEPGPRLAERILGLGEEPSRARGGPGSSGRRESGSVRVAKHPRQ